MTKSEKKLRRRQNRKAKRLQHRGQERGHYLSQSFLKGYLDTTQHNQVLHRYTLGTRSIWTAGVRDMGYAWDLTFAPQADGSWNRQVDTYIGKLEDSLMKNGIMGKEGSFIKLRDQEYIPSEVEKTDILKLVLARFILNPTMLVEAGKPIAAKMLEDMGHNLKRKYPPIILARQKQILLYENMWQKIDRLVTERISLLEEDDTDFVKACGLGQVFMCARVGYYLGRLQWRIYSSNIPLLLSDRPYFVQGEPDMETGSNEKEIVRWFPVSSKKCVAMSAGFSENSLCQMEDKMAEWFNQQMVDNSRQYFFSSVKSEALKDKAMSRTAHRTIIPYQ